jgi:RNA polymerase sigma factor (sigma-70 family)
MGKEWELDQGAFDKLLAWLNPDPEQAGRKYEGIRSRLIKIFTCRGCTIPEELADETINRVARKVPEIAATYTGDPALYFYGVGHNVYLEYVRKKPAPTPPPKPEPSQELEQEFECLEQCMQQLPPRSRELILQYYQEEKQAKIDHRKNVAQRLGMALNALRIQAHRIRAALQECVIDCLRQRALG